MAKKKKKKLGSLLSNPNLKGSLRFLCCWDQSSSNRLGNFHCHPHQIHLFQSLFLQFKAENFKATEFNLFTPILVVVKSAARKRRFGLNPQKCCGCWIPLSQKLPDGDPLWISSLFVLSSLYASPFIFSSSPPSFFLSFFVFCSKEKEEDGATKSNRKDIISDYHIQGTSDSLFRVYSTVMNQFYCCSNNMYRQFYRVSAQNLNNPFGYYSKAFWQFTTISISLGDIIRSLKFATQYRAMKLQNLKRDTPSFKEAVTGFHKRKAKSVNSGDTVFVAFWMFGLFTILWNKMDGYFASVVFWKIGLDMIIWKKTEVCSKFLLLNNVIYCVGVDCSCKFSSQERTIQSCFWLEVKPKEAIFKIGWNVWCIQIWMENFNVWFSFLLLTTTIYYIFVVCSSRFLPPKKIPLIWFWILFLFNRPLQVVKQINGSLIARNRYASFIFSWLTYFQYFLQWLYRILNCQMKNIMYSMERNNEQSCQNWKTWSTHGISLSPLSGLHCCKQGMRGLFKFRGIHQAKSTRLELIFNKASLSRTAIINF